jgi:hypothetical protein
MERRVPIPADGNSGVGKELAIFADGLFNDPRGNISDLTPPIFIDANELIVRGVARLLAGCIPMFLESFGSGFLVLAGEF